MYEIIFVHTRTHPYPLKPHTLAPLLGGSCVIGDEGPLQVRNTELHARVWDKLLLVPILDVLDVSQDGEYIEFPPAWTNVDPEAGEPAVDDEDVRVGVCVCVVLSHRRASSQRWSSCGCGVSWREVGGAGEKCRFHDLSASRGHRGCRG